MVALVVPIMSRADESSERRRILPRVGLPGSNRQDLAQVSLPPEPVQLFLHLSAGQRQEERIGLECQGQVGALLYPSPGSFHPQWCEQGGGRGPEGQ